MSNTKNKIYIVTGATGFVGSVLTKRLVELGHTVHAVVRSKEKADRVLDGLAVKIFVADSCDKDALAEAFDTKDAEYVVMHAAGIVQLSGNRYQFAQMRRVNVLGTQNMIDLCLKHNAKMMYISSVHALPALKKGETATETSIFNPNLVKGKYDKSKASACALVVDAIKNSGLDAVIIHPSGIIGPGDCSNTNTSLMIRDYLLGRIPAATKGGFNFVDIRDVIEGIIKAESTPSGSSFILSGRYCSAKEMLDILHEISGGKQITKTIPIWVGYLGLPFLWTWAKIRKKRPLYTAYHLFALSANSNYSSDLAVKELDYTARDLKETIADAVAYIKG